MIRRAYFELAGRQIHYREAGSPGTPALMLLHQTPSSSAMFEPLMALVACSYHCIAPDLAGMGMSDPLSGGDMMKGFAGDCLALADATFRGGFALFGHHTGAGIAVQMAFERPEAVSALALSGPPFLSDAQRAAVVESVKAPERDRAGSHLAALWQRIEAKDRGAPLGLLEREFAGAVLLGDCYQDVYAAVAAHPFADRFVAVECPILLIAGTEDSLRGCLGPASEARPDAHVAEIEGGTTYVCERDAAALAAILREFLPCTPPPGISV